MDRRCAHNPRSCGFEGQGFNDVSQAIGPITLLGRTTLPGSRFLAGNQQETDLCPSLGYFTLAKCRLDLSGLTLSSGLTPKAEKTSH